MDGGGNWRLRLAAQLAVAACAACVAGCGGDDTSNVEEEQGDATAHVDTGGPETSPPADASHEPTDAVAEAYACQAEYDGSTAQCNTCLGTTCCEPLAACYATPACAPAIPCFEQCSAADAEVLGCLATCSPDGGAAQQDFEQFGGCARTACAHACGITAIGSDGGDGGGSKP
jgi:hypothetical protein